MATWKKIITSGSSAELSSLTLDTALPVAQGGTGTDTLTDGGILLGSGTGAITATSVLTDGQILVGDGSGAPVAESGATLRTSIGVGTGDSPQFTGLTLSGDLTVQGGDITLTNAATDIDLIDNNASALSFDASGKAGILEIVTTDNAEQVKMSGNLSVTGIISGSTISGSFIGDGSNLTGTGFNIDELSNSLTKDTIATGDLFAVADINASNEEKKITFANVRDAMFEDVSGDATIAAGGALSLATDSVGSDEIAAGSVGNSELKQNENITLQALTTTNNVTVGGDLVVNGTTTTIATTNTKVEDQFMFLGTGSAETNKDIGIIAQSGSTDLSGSAFYHDTNSERWSVGKNVGQDATAITPTSFVTTVKTDTVNPDTTSGSYGAGEMHVNTSTGEVWIRFG